MDFPDPVEVSAIDSKMAVLWVEQSRAPCQGLFLVVVRFDPTEEIWRVSEIFEWINPMAPDLPYD